MNQLQKYALYLFCFSLNFEKWDPLNTGIDFIVTKVTITIYLLFSIADFKSLYSIKHFKLYFYPLFSFFLLLTFMSYINKTSTYSIFFNIPFFLNLLALIVAANQERRNPQILLKGLFVFSIGSVVMTLMYFSGMESISELENRVTIFGSNQNELGLNLAISILIFISIIYEIKLKFIKNMYLLYTTFPLMLIFLVRTGSRVAIISLFIGIIIFFLLIKTQIKGSKLFMILSLFFVLFFVWELYVKDTYVAERLFSSVNDGDLSGREIIWLTTIELFVKNPFFGMGETGYLYAFNFITEDGGSPHNVIIEVLCYTGIVGLIFFMVFLIRTFKCGIRSYTVTNEILPLILLIPISGMILSGQILGTKTAWLIITYIISGCLRNTLIYNRNKKIKNHTVKQHFL
jgi:O-antigen ligase